MSRPHAGPNFPDRTVHNIDCIASGTCLFVDGTLLRLIPVRWVELLVHLTLLDSRFSLMAGQSSVFV